MPVNMWSASKPTAYKYAIFIFFIFAASSHMCSVQHAMHVKNKVS